MEETKYQINVFAQQATLQLLQRGVHVILHGPAATGKSYVLEQAVTQGVLRSPLWVNQQAHRSWKEYIRRYHPVVQTPLQPLIFADDFLSLSDVFSEDTQGFQICAMTNDTVALQQWLQEMHAKGKTVPRVQASNHYDLSHVVDLCVVDY